MKPIAIVTGGTSGIGLATAQLLAENGYDIAICGRDAQRLRQAQLSIESARTGAQVLTVVADFATPSQAAAVGQRAHLQFGRIDVLVNAAATASLASFESATETQLEEALNVNVRSVFHLTQMVWRVMKDQGSGTIINISSLAAVDPFPGFSIYGSSKAWLDLFTKSLAREGQPFGIRVHSIQPGAVETPMLRGLFPNFPAQRTVMPQDVAAVVFGLLDPCWRQSNGQIVQVSRQS